MILDGKNNRKPEINYPCYWDYKIIGDNVEKMIEAAEAAADGMEYDITASNISKKGNYFSINLKVLVNNEDTRNLVYQKLEGHENIKMVL
ncbi:MAG: DUF493 domain-containing protein [Ignavibacteria bacterium]